MSPLPSSERRQPRSFAPKLSRTQADDVRRRYLSGETLTRLAAEFDVTVGALSRLVNNHTYRDSAARVALKLSAASALAFARLEARTGMPRRRLAEEVFEHGLEAYARELAE